MSRARPAVAWMLVAGAAAWVALRTLGLAGGYPLVPLVAYTPYAAGLAVIAVVVVAALRQWLAAGVAAVLALILVVTVVPRALGGPTSAQGGAGPAFGVLTVNLKVAGADAEAVVGLVRRTEADALALQETDAGALARLEDAGLRDLLGHRHFARGPDTQGTALYTRAPQRVLAGPRGTSRPLAAAVVRVPGAPPVRVTAVHAMAPLDGPGTDRWAADFRRLAPATPDGSLRVLAGDFNATLDHEPLRELLDTGYADAAAQLGAGLEPTWPDGRVFPPPVTIDHVLADARIGVRAYAVHPVPDSDHHAVFARLELPAR